MSDITDREFILACVNFVMGDILNKAVKYDCPCGRAKKQWTITKDQAVFHHTDGVCVWTCRTRPVRRYGYLVYDHRRKFWTCTFLVVA